MDEIISEFLVESYEGLDRIDRNLIALEKSPDDHGILQEIFRALHTVKGTCGFLGFDRLEQLAHAAENLLSVLRDGELSMSAEITDALLATVADVRTILVAVEETGHEGDPEVDGLVARLAAMATMGAEPTTGNDGYSRSDGTGRLGDRLVDAGAAERTDVEIAATEQSLGDRREIGKILVADGRASETEVEAAAASQHRRSMAESSIRVDVALLDQLMNLVGELVLSRNQIVQLAAESGNEGLGPASQRLNTITSRLQEGVMKTRMQPIDNAWARLHRVVRDLSRQLGKSVTVELLGRDTELDRTIIEAIKDPLTHIVRNTVDHGIESPAERLAAGKPEAGRLVLRASHEAGQVSIEISDDGRGMDPTVLAATAVASGIATTEQVASMTDQEKVELSFEPGFSTAAAVSNVSGRGVGMDVVRSNVEQIGGTVDVRTALGVGTTFRIRIPLTLAIIPALMVRCDGQRYAVPQINLLELIRLEAGDEANRIEHLSGAPVYRLRGRLLPIVDLRDQLGSERAERMSTNIVVLRAGDRTFGLIVDAIEDTEEIVVKPLGRPVVDVGLFAGATIAGDGRVALILDLVGLATEANVLEPGGSETEPSPGDAAVDPAALLEDRTLLVLGLGGSDRVAIPLATVERLEEFPSAALERSDGQTVVRYRGAVMPLIDLASTIGLGASALGGRERVNVVACRFAGRYVGLAVASILDIVTNAEVLATVSDEVETVLIDDRLTDVLDPAAVVSSVLPIPSPTDDLASDLHSGAAAPTGA